MGVEFLLHVSPLRLLRKVDGPPTPVVGRVNVPLLFTYVDDVREDRGCLPSANRNTGVSRLRKPSASTLQVPALTGDRPEVHEDPGFAVAVPDLANPPDVSPAAFEHSGILVTDLDDIAARVQKHTRSRHEDVTAVEALINAAIGRLIARERENRAEAVLRTLHIKAARTRDRELEQAVNRLEEGDCDPEAVLSDFASALTGRLLADPTEALRAAARNGDVETVSG